MPSNHLILCRPFLLLPSIFPSIRVFSKVSALHMRWPKYWNFNISPSNEYSELISASCKEPTCQGRRCKRHESDPWVGKIPWRRVRNPLQYSSLGNPMDRGAWWARVHRATKSWTWLSDLAQGGQRRSQVRVQQQASRGPTVTTATESTPGGLAPGLQVSWSRNIFIPLASTGRNQALRRKEKSQQL